MDKLKYVTKNKFFIFGLSFSTQATDILSSTSEFMHTQKSPEDRYSEYRYVWEHVSIHSRWKEYPLCGSCVYFSAFQSNKFRSTEIGRILLIDLIALKNSTKKKQIRNEQQQIIYIIIRNFHFQGEHKKLYIQINTMLETKWMNLDVLNLNQKW